MSNSRAIGACPGALQSSTNSETQSFPCKEDNFHQVINNWLCENLKNVNMLMNIHGQLTSN